MTFVVCLAAVVLIKRPPAAESTPSIIKAFILDEGIRLGILSRNRAVFLDGEAEMARRDCCHEIHTVVLTCISWHEKRQNRLIFRHEINGSVLTCISWPGGSGALPHHPGPKSPSAATASAACPKMQVVDKLLYRFVLAERITTFVAFGNQKHSTI